MAAKPHEAWAKAGLGLVLSTSRIKRVKRVFQRACFRSLAEGAASYKKDQTIYPKDIPWRFRQAWQHRQSSTSSKCDRSSVRLTGISPFLADPVLERLALTSL